MEGFTLVLCRADGCAQNVDTEREPVERALSEATRRCPHGVMVLTDCLMGPLACRVRGRTGRMAVVQPCRASRRPTGPSILVGPIRSAEDARELGRWLHSGALTSDTLPDQLRDYARTLRAAARN
jgi:hypothetical protein